MAQKKLKLVQVNVRLYADDVEEIKRQCAAAGESDGVTPAWHPRLRRLVHESVTVKRPKIL